MFMNLWLPPTKNRAMGSGIKYVINRVENDSEEHRMLNANEFIKENESLEYNTFRQKYC